MKLRSYALLLLLAPVVAGIGLLPSVASPTNPPANPPQMPPRPTFPARLSERGTATEAQRKELVALYQTMARLFKEKKYAEAKPVMNALIKRQPDNMHHWYNLACINSQLGESDEAVLNLITAMEKGWSNFRHMDRDEDLDKIRQVPAFKALMEHRELIQRGRAEAISKKLVERLGGNYLHEIDDDLRLVFATDVDRRTLDDLKATLTDYAHGLQKDLFTFGLDTYLTVVVPKNWPNSPVRGFFRNTDNYLAAQTVGSHLIHEFTHALHHADQNGHNQEHPIWIVEGFGTLYENSDVVDGRVVPLPNYRLIALQRAVASRKHLPLEKFILQSRTDFMRNAALNYAQTRYVMMYLHETSMLRKWYDAYVRNYATDSTGKIAFEEAYGKKLSEINNDWAKWVKEQKPPTVSPRKGAPTLGVKLETVNDGFKIVSVLPDSAAQKAGLQAGDVLIEVDSERILSMETLAQVLDIRQVGDEIPVEYRRNGEYHETTVVLTPAADPKKSAPKESPSGKLP
jgi:hypothetical protein